ncbi:MAG: MmcQ/YjbR family DNA-binding protein [bacterium]|nr:MmcQ/YjbR family DNA-binding protein [bacterium]
MNFDDVRKIAFAFPGVEEHLVFGGPTLKVGKRFLACIAKIDHDTLVVKVPDPFERDFLLSSNPDVYYMQEHYATFDCVLIRMSKADSEEVRQLIENAWRKFAPKRVVAAYDAQG